MLSGSVARMCTCDKEAILGQGSGKLLYLKSDTKEDGEKTHRPAVSARGWGGVGARHTSSFPSGMSHDTSSPSQQPRSQPISG